MQHELTNKTQNEIPFLLSWNHDKEQNICFVTNGATITEGDTLNYYGKENIVKYKINKILKTNTKFNRVTVYAQATRTAVLYHPEKNN